MTLIDAEEVETRLKEILKFEGNLDLTYGMLVELLKLVEVEAKAAYSKGRRLTEETEVAVRVDQLQRLVDTYKHEGDLNEFTISVASVQNRINKLNQAGLQGNI